MSLSRLLWLDSRAGLAVGALSLVVAPWLAAFYGLSLAVILTVAAANVAYGTFSFWLSKQPQPPRALVLALIAANAAWSLLCFGAVAHFYGDASVFGLAQFILEGGFVGALAYAEWRALPSLTQHD